MPHIVLTRMNNLKCLQRSSKVAMKIEQALVLTKPVLKKQSTFKKPVMKFKYMHSVAIKSFVHNICTATGFFLSAGRQQVKFVASTIGPAARGAVDIKKDNYEEYDIQIALSSLAEPDRLQPSKKTYVVWMK